MTYAEKVYKDMRGADTVVRNLRQMTRIKLIRLWEKNRRASGFYWNSTRNVVCEKCKGFVLEDHPNNFFMPLPAGWEGSCWFCGESIDKSK